MINSESAQVVWNISENRPANGNELANLINKGWLLMNFAIRNNDGKVWIDLADKAEEEFEIRSQQVEHGENCHCNDCYSRRIVQEERSVAIQEAVSAQSSGHRTRDYCSCEKPTVMTYGDTQYCTSCSRPCL